MVTIEEEELTEVTFEGDEITQITMDGDVLWTLETVPESGILRYDFEGSLDDIWNDNDGTQFGGSFVSDSVFGSQSLDLESGDNYFEYPILDLTTGDNEWSVAFWIKHNISPSSAENRQFLWHPRGEYDVNLHISDGDSGFMEGEIIFEVWDGSSGAFLESGEIATEGDWRHVALTHDNLDFSLYVDGSLAASDSMSDAVSINEENVFGYLPDGNQLHADVRVDDFDIYDKELNGLEVSSLYDSGSIDSAESIPESIEDGVAYWPIDEGSGLTFNEGIAGLDATASTDDWTTQAEATDPVFEFDGVDNDATIPHNDDLTGFSEFTFSAWVYNRGHSDKRGQIISKYAGSGEYQFGIDGLSGTNDLIIVYGDGDDFGFFDTGSDGTDSPGVPTDEWTMVTMAVDLTTDPPECDIYHDTNFQGTDDRDSNVEGDSLNTDPNQDVFIGSQDGDRYFDGHIQRLVIDNTQWDSSQVEAYYDDTEGFYS